MRQQASKILGTLAASALVVLIGGCDSSGGTIPTAGSKAGNVSVGRQAFILQVDQICATDFNSGQSADKELSDLQALGDPPDGQDLFHQWLDNVRQRAQLGHDIQTAQQRDDNQTVQSLTDKVYALKRDGNGIGEQFGLQVCTSNGPQPT